MNKIVLFSLVGLLILLLGGCGLMPFATPEVEQPSIEEPPEVPEGLELVRNPAPAITIDLDGWHIPDGWDPVGTWDFGSKTATLTKDITITEGDGIRIDSDGVTLDGNGYTITGPGTGPGSSTGVYLYERTGVTIENLNVQNFRWGIRLYSSNDNTLTDNTVNDNYLGIMLEYSSSNTLTNNTTNNWQHGIILSYSSSNNTLTNNTANNNWQQGIYLCCGSSNNTLTNNTVNRYGIDGGIYFHGSSSNTLTNNTVTNNSCGIRFRYNSNDNEVYNNNFIDNSTQARVEGGSGNEFNLDKPDGGNYWSSWTSPDNDGDGFVDVPYGFYGGQDGLPWVSQDGWKNIPPVADAGPDKTALIGETVQFDGSNSYDPVGTIEAYEWDFGDETTGSGEKTSHIYDIAGDYTVTLTVTDDDGLTGSDTAEITVQTPAEATGDLITTVEDFKLPKGIEKSLIALLATAINALENHHEQAAIGQLTGFIHYVEAQNGKKLTEEQAGTLIAAAQRIIDSIQ